MKRSALPVLVIALAAFVAGGCGSQVPTMRQTLRGITKPVRDLTRPLPVPGDRWYFKCSDRGVGDIYWFSVKRDLCPSISFPAKAASDKQRNKLDGPLGGRLKMRLGMTEDTATSHDGREVVIRDIRWIR